MPVPSLPRTRVTSITRITLGVMLGLAVPFCAWILDPGFASPVHKILLGAFVLLFVISDTFMSGSIASYANLAGSSALTLREAQRLQVQLKRTRRALRHTWWVGLLLRAAHTVVLSALLAQGEGSVAATLTLVGYALLGLSTTVVISLGSTFWMAEQFRENFIVDERREIERQRLLARAH